jgi:hypothetical protein
MAYELDISGFRGEKLVIGLSTIVGVTCLSFQNAVTFKNALGGSCELGGASLTWGQGYLLGVSGLPVEIVNINGRGTFFACATGATVTAYIFRGGTDPTLG